jgi:threonine/homoserine/homoserine lactone efflux protein
MTAPDPSRLAIFVAAALALLVVPGPAVLYVVAHGIGGGRRAGLASTAGIHTGTLVHIVAATAGLSAVLASSATAFDVVKYAGALYLVVVGVRRLLARRGGGSPVDAAPPRALGRIYRQGIVVNVLNPKTALFFLAFLPQFVDSSRGGTAQQILLLGLIFAALGLVSDSAYALVAGTLGERLRRSDRYLEGERLVSGCVFLGLGAFAALTASPRPR